VRHRLPGAQRVGQDDDEALHPGPDPPTSGTATVLGRPNRELARPMRRVGALVDPQARHPGRTAYAHLLALAQSNALPPQRVDDVIEMVGLETVAHERVGGFSLGMGQRLGIAAALLGDPDVLLLDEPVNGLDPEGIRWMRELLRDRADEGRTVLVSSHLMSEMEDTADHLVVLGRGRLLADVPMEDLLGAHAAVRVRSPQAPLLASALQRAGGTVELQIDGSQRVDGWTSPWSATSRWPPACGCTSSPASPSRWRPPTSHSPATTWSTARSRREPGGAVPCAAAQ
jgi:ABC-2 type transport system ATP-binding protein